MPLPETISTFVAGDPLHAADLNKVRTNLSYLDTAVNAQIQIGAWSMQPNATWPSAYGELQTATNTVNYRFMDFADNSGYVIAEFGFVLPADYDSGTMTAKIYWTANSTSTNVVTWGVRMMCMDDNGALDTAWGTIQNVNDANKSTAYYLNVTDSTPAITIAGTPAPGKFCMCRVNRYSADANDTLAATARLIMVVLTYTRT